MKRLSFAVATISLAIFACSDSSSDASSASLPEVVGNLTELQHLECNKDNEGIVVTIAENLTVL